MISHNLIHVLPEICKQSDPLSPVHWAVTVITTNQFKSALVTCLSNRLFEYLSQSPQRICYVLQHSYHAKTPSALSPCSFVIDSEHCHAVHLLIAQKYLSALSHCSFIIGSQHCHTVHSSLALSVVTLFSQISRRCWTCLPQNWFNW